MSTLRSMPWIGPLRVSKFQSSGRARLRVIAAECRTATDVLAEFGAKSAAAKKVHDSYMAFRERTAAWSRISLKAVLEAREPL